jgi:tRNA dimethylallyltransferase
MQQLLVIVGPTGSHKSDLAITLAKKYHGAIINADAFQVYKEIKKGTGQLLQTKNPSIPMYLNGSVSIFDD